jgi:hypothetical protein
MREFILHLPVNYNDTTPIDSVYIAGIEKYLLRNFGGFTKQAVSGAWLDDRTDTIYNEPMTRYKVAAEDNDAYAEFVIVYG